MKPQFLCQIWRIISVDLDKIAQQIMHENCHGKNCLFQLKSLKGKFNAICRFGSP